MEDDQKSPGHARLFVADESRDATAKETIEDFCTWYTHEELQEELLDLFLAAINSEEADNWNVSVRGDFIFLYRQLAKLIRAVYADRTTVRSEAGC